MKFIIRDDDLNYFNKPSDIEMWYKDVFDLGIPVGFSVIPFIKTRSDILGLPLIDDNKEYPISKNRELVVFLKKNPLIEIMMHGCTHEIFNWKFEYESEVDLFERTERGKKELEKTFEREIKIFVPPHDRISNQGILAVETAGMNIIRGIGSKNFLFRPQYFKAIWKMALHRLKFPNKQKTPAYPFVIDFGKHKEAYSNRLNEDNLEDLIRRLKFCHEVNGNFIVTLHLYAFNQKIKDNLMFLIKMAKELKAKFVYPSNLFE